MEGVCQSISSSVPPDQRSVPLAQIANPLLASLELAVTHTKADPGNQNVERILIAVDRLNAIFKCYNHPEGVADLSGMLFLNSLQASWGLGACDYSS